MGDRPLAPWFCKYSLRSRPDPGYHILGTMSRISDLGYQVLATMLMYGLESVWLLRGDKKNFDRKSCLRKILRVPAAYTSRASDATALHSLDGMPLSRLSLAQQPKLFGSFAAARDEDLCLSLALEPGDGISRWHTRRCVGRPRSRWSACVPAQALLLADNRHAKTIKCTIKHSSIKSMHRVGATHLVLSYLTTRS